MEAGALCFMKLLLFCQLSVSFSYLRLSATATATATVAPTMGLLPIEIRRFIRQKPIAYASLFFQYTPHLGKINMQAGKYRKEIFKCLSSRKVPPDLFYVFSSQYAKTGFGTMKGKARDFPSYFRLSTTTTSTTTVAPTAGLLPIEIRRFIRQKPTVLFFFSPLSSLQKLFASISFFFHPNIFI